MGLPVIESVDSSAEEAGEQLSATALHQLIQIRNAEVSLLPAESIAVCAGVSAAPAGECDCVHAVAAGLNH